jgi:hypothetical protein
VSADQNISGPDDEGPEPKEIDLRDFMYSAHEGDRMGMVSFLMKFGVHHIDDTRGEPMKLNAMLWAIEKGRTESVDYLLSSGANIEYREGLTGNTPLIKAAGKGDVATTKLLIERGAHLYAVNNSNQTAEEAALAAGKTETATLVRDEMLLRERLRREELDRTAAAFHTGLEQKTPVKHALRRRPGGP